MVCRHARVRAGKYKHCLKLYKYCGKFEAIEAEGLNLRIIVRFKLYENIQNTELFTKKSPATGGAFFSHLLGGSSTHWGE